MNPFDLTASDLLVWGIVAHLIADWPLQNDWMANRKAFDPTANIVHAGIHAIALAFVFGMPALALGLVHGLIDTRKPVVWWSKLMRQTQPSGRWVDTTDQRLLERNRYVPLYDVGTEVRFWTDQVFHIACIAIAALVVG